MVVRLDFWKCSENKWNMCIPVMQYHRDGLRQTEAQVMRAYAVRLRVEAEALIRLERKLSAPQPAAIDLN